MSPLYHPILYVIQVKMLIKESRICKIQVCAGNQKLRDFWRAQKASSGAYLLLFTKNSSFLKICFKNKKICYKIKRNANKRKSVQTTKWQQKTKKSLKSAKIAMNQFARNSVCSDKIFLSGTLVLCAVYQYCRHVISYQRKPSTTELPQQMD